MFGLNTQGTNIDILVARKRYGKAVKLLRRNLKHDPDNIRLRQRLADVLALQGEGNEAVQILYPLVDEFVESGFIAKAIAVLKKMQRIEPGHDVVEERLATLVRRRTEGTREVEVPPNSPAATVLNPNPGPSSKKPPLPPTEMLQIINLEEEHPTDGLEGLRRSALFGEFSEEELLALIRGFQLHRLEPGEIVVTEGQTGDSLFVLASGTVRVYVTNPSGRNEQVRTHIQGEFFGEVSLLSRQPRSATITCATACEILELDRATLTDITHRHTEITRIIETFYQRRVNSPEEVGVRTAIEIPL